MPTLFSVSRSIPGITEDSKWRTQRLLPHHGKDFFCLLVERFSSHVLLIFSAAQRNFRELPMPWIVLSALALCAPSQLSRRDGHGAFCTTACKQEVSFSLLATFPPPLFSPNSSSTAHYHTAKYWMRYATALAQAANFARAIRWLCSPPGCGHSSFPLLFLLQSDASFPVNHATLGLCLSLASMALHTSDASPCSVDGAGHALIYRTFPF